MIFLLGFDCGIGVAVQRPTWALSFGGDSYFGDTLSHAALLCCNCTIFSIKYNTNRVFYFVNSWFFYCFFFRESCPHWILFGLLHSRLPLARCFSVYDLGKGRPNGILFGDILAITTEDLFWGGGFILTLSKIWRSLFAATVSQFGFGWRLKQINKCYFYDSDFCVIAVSLKLVGVLLNRLIDYSCRLDAFQIHLRLWQ